MKLVRVKKGGDLLHPEPTKEEKEFIRQLRRHFNDETIGWTTPTTQARTI